MSRRATRRKDAADVLERLGYRFEDPEFRSRSMLADEPPAGAPDKDEAPAGTTRPRSRGRRR